MDSEEQEPLINELPGVEPGETDPCSVSANVERQGAYHGVAPAASETFSESRVQEPANVMPEDYRSERQVRNRQPPSTLKYAALGNPYVSSVQTATNFWSRQFLSPPGHFIQFLRFLFFLLHFPFGLCQYYTQVACSGERFIDVKRKYTMNC